MEVLAHQYAEESSADREYRNVEKYDGTKGEVEQERNIDHANDNSI